MRNNETGEFELVVGNRQLLSGFFIVVLLFAVAFAMGYVVGQNSPRTAKTTGGSGRLASPSQTSDGRPQPAPPPVPAPSKSADKSPPAAASRRCAARSRPQARRSRRAGAAAACGSRRRAARCRSNRRPAHTGR